VNDRSAVEAICRLAGLRLSAAELEQVGQLLAAQAGRTAALGRVDTSGVEPITSFDPRWPATPDGP
jgi:Asp-tRNA(Asn)/Glu-tRNA(Gln) amidotransferase C subunit